MSRYLRRPPQGGPEEDDDRAPPLAAMRGILWGLAMSTVLWILLLCVLGAWWLMRATGR